MLLLAASRRERRTQTWAVARRRRTGFEVMTMMEGCARGGMKGRRDVRDEKEFGAMYFVETAGEGGRQSV